jgi:hyperosmotically inducible protein
MNIMRKNIIVTGLTIATLVAAGGAPVYAQNTTGEKIEKKTEETKDKAKTMGHEAKTGMSDSWITSKTKIAVFADDRVKGTQVHVETKDGTVMLRGKVDSNEAKTAAAEITKGIEG